MRALLTYPVGIVPLLAIAALLFAVVPGTATIAAADTSSAQLLLQALLSPTPAPTSSVATPISITSQPAIVVPLGVSLQSLGTTNAIIPQVAATTTATTATATSTNTSLIQTLWAEVRALEAQIAALLASSTPTAGGSSVSSSSSAQTCSPLTLTGPLSIGSKGSQVAALQNFLESEGYYTYPSITGYFGSATEHAVQAFQKTHSIVSSGTLQTTGYGLVGRKTEALIKSISAECTASAPASAQSVTTATSTTAATTSATTPSAVVPTTSTPGFGGGGGGRGGGGGGSTPADSTAPTTPTGLSAIVVSSSQINLSWTASADNGGGDSCCTYQIYRDGTQVGTAATNSYSDTGLSAATLHTYWVSAKDTTGNVSTTTSGVSAQTNYGADQYGTTWKPLRIGGGGYITGIDIALDGTKVIRTDTYGAYLWDGTQWDQLVSSSTMPAPFTPNNYDAGVYEIRVAPSNTNRFYMGYKGYLYRSDNRGASWTQTVFPQSTMNSDNSRADGEKMAIDPQNQNIVFAGTSGAGVYKTTNAGSSWSPVLSIATSTTYDYAIAYDPTSSVVGGATQGIYIASYGTGVYHSTDGGTTWTLLNSSGMPTTFRHMIVDQNGVLWLTDNSTGALNKYSGGAWSTISGAGTGLQSVAVDPANASHIVVGQQGGGLYVSTNGGSLWTQPSSVTRVATDIPWLAWTNENYMTNGNMEFDPTGSNKLYFAEGIGVWYSTPPSNNSALTWNSQNTGVEQLVPELLVAPPGGVPLAGNLDRPVFYISNPDAFPSTHGPNNTYSIIAGYDIDYASNNPSFVAGIFNFGGFGDVSSYSTNSGYSWTAFPSLPASGTYGGNLAIASSTNMVWISGGNNVYYTNNGGTTWATTTPPGTTSGDGGWHIDAMSGLSLRRHILTADRVNIGTYYAFNTNDGVYRSTNGGASWTLVSSTSPSSFTNWNAKMRAVPNKAGELFYTGGSEGSPTDTHPYLNDPFTHSTNGGATWVAVPNVYEVQDFGFGKPAAGTTTPAIYIAGWVNSQYGIYESDDDASTWTQIGLWPTESLNNVVAISGDMNIYGRVYVGLGGQGWVYGNTTNAQIPPLITNVASSAVGTTATITWTTDQSSNSKVVYGTTSSYGSSASNASLVTSHSIQLSGLPSSTTYHFAVVSANSNSYTSTSTDYTFVTPDTTPPTQPTNLTATSTYFNEIDLSWTASTDNGGADSCCSYEVFRNGTQVATTSTTTYSDIGLTASTTYTYNIAAYDASSNVSTQSSSAVATTTGGSYNAQTMAWASAVSSAGGSVSTKQENNVDKLISCYKTAGVFSLLDREWLLWADNLQQGQIDIIHDATWTSHGTSGFNNDAGYTGDGSTSYLDTGYNPSTAGGNYSQDSAELDLYVSHQGTNTNTDIGLNNNNGCPFTYINPNSAGNFQFGMNGCSFPSTSTASAIGLWSVTRVSSTTVNAYKNGSLDDSSTGNSSSVLVNGDFYVGASNQTTAGVGHYSNDTLDMVSIGGALTGTQENAKASCDNAYATSKGFNVF